MRKPTPESVTASIKNIQYHHWAGTTFVSCLVERDDGHLEDGYSRPIDADDFDLEVGQRAALRKAMDKMFDKAVAEYRSSCAMLAGAQSVLSRRGVGSDDIALHLGDV